jgi:hypothetical protein
MKKMAKIQNEQGVDPQPGEPYYDMHLSLKTVWRSFLAWLHSNTVTRIRPSDLPHIAKALGWGTGVVPNADGTPFIAKPEHATPPTGESQ